MGRSPGMESGRRSLGEAYGACSDFTSDKVRQSRVTEKCRALTSGGRCAPPTESHYSHAREAPRRLRLAFCRGGYKRIGDIVDCKMKKKRRQTTRLTPLLFTSIELRVNK